MNLLFVCSARTWGGNERWTAMAMHELSPNHKVYLCYRSTELAALFGKNISKTRVPFRSIVDMITYFKIIRIIREHQIDIVVSTKRKEYWICALICRWLKIPHVIRLGINRPLSRLPWKRWIYEQGCNAVLVNARAVKKGLIESGYKHPEKIHIVYNGVVLPKPAQKTQRSGFKIISVGALIPRKGHDCLLNAVAMLPDEFRKQITVQFLGEGSDRSRLVSLAVSLKIRQQVIFSGFQPDAPQWIRESDLFVLLSDNEGLANGLLEAMAQGVPVLTTRAGGADELIQSEKNGLLVQQDPADVKQALQECMNHPEKLQAWGIAGRQTVASRFTLKRMAEQLEILFSEAAHAS